MRYRYRNEEEMNDSNIEWIGDIPYKWKTISLKHVITEVIDNRGKTPPIQESGIPLLEIDSLVGENYNPNIEIVSKFISKETYQYFLRKYLESGDILFATVGSIGRIGIVPDKFNYCIAQNIVGFRGDRNKIISKYLLFYMLSDAFQNTMMQYNKGNIQDSIKISNLIQGKILLPRLSEQNKIAKFLDEKTAQFDSIISKKQELIQKLEEAKKSLISEVVTGKVKVVKTSDGYDLVERKKEEMKESSVEWLGNIPKSWNTTKLKFKTSQINRGKSPEYVEESNIKVINQACIYWDKFKFQNVKYQDENIKGDRGKLYKGDILVNSTGTGTLGRANIFNEEGDFIVDSHVTIIRCFEIEYAKYLKNVLRTDLFQGLIYSTMVTGSTNQIELSREGLRNMTVLDLNNEELIIINDLLDLRINDINNTIMKTYIQIDKIKEAKQSLISEAVTGKIEVLD